MASSFSKLLDQNLRQVPASKRVCPPPPVLDLTRFEAPPEQPQQFLLPIRVHIPKLPEDFKDVTLSTLLRKAIEAHQRLPDQDMFSVLEHCAAAEELVIAPNGTVARTVKGTIGTPVEEPVKSADYDQLEQMLLPICQKYWRTHLPWNMIKLMQDKRQTLILLQMQDTVGTLPQVTTWVEEFMQGVPVWCDVASLEEPLTLYLQSVWNGPTVTQALTDRHAKPSIPVLYSMTQDRLAYLCDFLQSYKGPKRLVVVHEDCFAEGWQRLRKLLYPPNGVIKIPLLAAACLSQCMHALRNYLPADTPVRQLLLYAAGNPRNLIHCILMQQSAGAGVSFTPPAMLTLGNTLLLQGPPVHDHFLLQSISRPAQLLFLQVQQCPAVLHLALVTPHEIQCTVNTRRLQQSSVKQQWAHILEQCHAKRIESYNQTMSTPCSASLQLYIYLNYPLAVQVLGTFAKDVNQRVRAVSHIMDDLALADIWTTRHYDPTFIIERTTYETALTLLQTPPERTFTFATRAEYAHRNPNAPESVYYTWLQKIKSTSRPPVRLPPVATHALSGLAFVAAYKKYQHLQNDQDQVWAAVLPKSITPAYISHWYEFFFATPLHKAVATELNLDAFYHDHACQVRAQLPGVADALCLGLVIDPYALLWDVYIPTKAQATAVDDFVRYSAMAFFHCGPAPHSLDRRPTWQCGAPTIFSARGVALWFTSRAQYDFTAGIAWKLAWAAFVETSTLRQLSPHLLVDKIVQLLQAALRQAETDRPKPTLKHTKPNFYWPRCLQCRSNETHCLVCAGHIHSVQTVIIAAGAI